MNKPMTPHPVGHLHGIALLNDPTGNKGTAFTEDERCAVRPRGSASAFGGEPGPAD